jgi:hypothetical protein
MFIVFCRPSMQVQRTYLADPEQFCPDASPVANFSQLIQYYTVSTAETASQSGTDIKQQQTH